MQLPAAAVLMRMLQGWMDTSWGCQGTLAVRMDMSGMGACMGMLGLGPCMGMVRKRMASRGRRMGLPRMS